MKKLFMFFMFLFFICNMLFTQDNPTVDDKKEQLFFISTVDQLRLRSTPSLVGKVVDTLKSGEEVEYLGETTQETTVVNIDNNPIDEPWMKVKTKRLTEGWAWRGFLKNKNPIKDFFSDDYGKSYHLMLGTGNHFPSWRMNTVFSGEEYSFVLSVTNVNDKTFIGDIGFILYNADTKQMLSVFQIVYNIVLTSKATKDISVRVPKELMKKAGSYYISSLTRQDRMEIFNLTYETGCCSIGRYPFSMGFTVIEYVDPMIFLTKVNTDVYKEPKLNAMKVEPITANTEVFFLGEVSDTTTTINVAGKAIEEPWLRVRTLKGITGWMWRGTLTLKRNRTDLFLTSLNDGQNLILSYHTGYSIQTAEGKSVDRNCLNNNQIYTAEVALTNISKETFNGDVTVVINNDSGTVKKIKTFYANIIKSSQIKNYTFSFDLKGLKNDEYRIDVIVEEKKYKDKIESFFSYGERESLDNRFYLGENTAPRRRKLYGFIDNNGKVIVEPIYDFVHSFNEGIAVVEKNFMMGCIDLEGNEIIPIKYAIYSRYMYEEDFKSGVYFSEGLIAVKDRKTEKWGYLDKKGDVIIPFLYDDARFFSEGLAAVAKTNDGIKRWGFIDKQGNVIIDFIYISALSYSEGFARVFHEELTFPASNEYESDIRYYRGAYIDKTGKEVIKGLFSRADIFKNGVAYTEKFSTTGEGYVLERVYIDKKGNELKNNETIKTVENVIPKSIINYVDINGYVYIDKEREKTHVSVSKFSEGMAVYSRSVRENNKYYDKYGYIGIDRYIAIKDKYDVANDFKDGLALVGIREDLDFMLYGSYSRYKYMYIDKYGKVIIDSHNEYHYEGAFCEKRAKISKSTY